MAKISTKRLEWREVTYSAEHFALLEDYRKKTLTIMEALDKALIRSIVHGSIARGDVTKKSDIDVFIPEPPSSYRIEAALDAATTAAAKRSVVQATPAYAMKGYLGLKEHTTVSFPLMKMRRVEREFYRFGGEASDEDLNRNMRVCGVDKRLMLIEPTQLGHRESSIVDHEDHAAKTLAISVETVLDRFRALSRRDEIGRTGVFIERELHQNETFEMALNRLADENPAVRRRLENVS